MPSKQNDCRNKITAFRLCLWGILCALCICLGYLESLLPTIIAPGIKLGLSNGIALILILTKDYKGAFAVNTVRILLSALLFASPATLIYSLTAGILSTCAAAAFSSMRSLSGVGLSVIGAFVHNIAQIAVAWILLGRGVLYYLPFLLLSALITGIAIGILSEIISKKLKTKR